jgi:tripartite-type tricarboxylate transporter receptor subunit TctC
VTYGTAAVGSAPHVNMVKFENMAHVKLQAIHYRGASPALNDVMASHINMMCVSTSLVLQPFRDHRLKIIAVGAQHRVEQIPEIPTVAETVPGYEAATWFGLATTGGTPPEIVAKINADVQRVVNEPEFRAKFMTPQMFEPMSGTPQEFAAYIHSEIGNWAKVIREEKLSIQ